MFQTKSSCYPKQRIKQVWIKILQVANKEFCLIGQTRDFVSFPRKCYHKFRRLPIISMETFLKFITNQTHLQIACFQKQGRTVKFTWEDCLVLSKDYCLDFPNNLSPLSNWLTAVTFTALSALGMHQQPPESAPGFWWDSRKLKTGVYLVMRHFQRTAERQRAAVIVFSLTYTKRWIHPPGKLSTFLMYFHFCAFKFIQFFPYCRLTNNNDICNCKKHEDRTSRMQDE